jgi:ribonuclease HII
MTFVEGIAGTELEERLIAEGYIAIGGVDEAGRGALAGPVVAACVVPGEGFNPEGITDSKKLSPARRAKLCQRILTSAQAVGVGIVEAKDIDRMNILAATLEAMRLAFLQCDPRPDAVLVDGTHAFAAPVPVYTMIKGDNLSLAIASASIVAKVTRDSIMDGISSNITGYGFEQHKGYGTAEHLRAIYAKGPSEIHRLSFAPMCDMEQGLLFDRTEDGIF